MPDVRWPTDEGMDVVGYRLELVDPTDAILQEIRGGEATRKDIARTYALLIRDYWHQVNWPVVNRAIVERWSRSALEYIKRRAWAIVAGRVAFDA